MGTRVPGAAIGRRIKPGCHGWASAVHVWEPGLSGAASAMQPVHGEAWAISLPLPLAQSWRGSSAIVCVAGASGNFKHHLFDPNSAFKRVLWRLSLAHPGLSDHLASLSLLAQSQPSCWDGLQGRRRAGTTSSVFFLLISVHCFPDAL